MRTSQKQAVMRTAKMDYTDSDEVFVVSSEDEANGVLEEFGRIESERQRMKLQLEARLRQLDTEERELREKYEAPLAQWGRGELTRRGKGKSVNLLQGTLKFISRAETLKVTDPAAALAYVKAHDDLGELIIRTEAVNKIHYHHHAKEVLKNAGEILPGVEVIAAKEEFALSFPRMAGSGLGVDDEKTED